MAYNVGTSNITADGVIGPSGRPIRVYSFVVHSGGTAAVVSFYSGTSSSGTKLIQIDGTINKSVVVTFEEGLLFSAGCYCDLDTNTTFVTTSYAAEI